ncbi:MAG: transcriptional regulator [Clostridia bacterium]|nr:transcriptional regulator [Clostridia bacterium]
MARIIENPHQLILDTAKNILFTKGYSELSMRNVAKECDIAIGTIYNYFPTKRDLVVEMMSGYWRAYFAIFEGVVQEDIPFFLKLQTIFEELETFIKTFKEVWLRPELYQTPDYVENGLKKENLYMERLVKRFEDFLLTESSKPNPEITLKLDSYETAKFILLNFITIIQMPTFKYSSFQVFLKELLQ